MKTDLLLTIFSSVAMIVLSTHAADFDKLSGASHEEFKTLRLQREAIKQRVEQIEGRVYLQFPELREWESKLVEIQNKPSLAGRAVTEFLKKHPAASDAYKQLCMDWMQIATADAVADTEKSEILKYVLAGTWQENISRAMNPDVKVFSNFEDSWQALQQHSSDSRARATRSIQRLEKDAAFPDFVSAQARDDAYSRFHVEVLYGPAIALKTPAELRKARDELHQLEIKMTSIFPEWHEIESDMAKTLDQVSEPSSIHEHLQMEGKRGVLEKDRETAEVSQGDVASRSDDAFAQRETVVRLVNPTSVIGAVILVSVIVGVVTVILMRVKDHRHSSS